MLRILFLPLLFSSFLISSPLFTVRLGVFSLKNELQLSNTLDRFSPALKKTVRTYRKDRFIYVHTIPTDNKKPLTKLLPAYRKIFSDAYIDRTK
ncbi:MAG: hypothetical protein ABXS91_02770 [Sulfurimonas sp.]